MAHVTVANFLFSFTNFKTSMQFDNKFAAIVTVRASSTRLEKKCFKTLFNDLSMIMIVIRRAKKIGCQVILATSEDTSDDRLIDNDY